MAKFTFLEIHLDDSEVNASASAPFAPGEKAVDAAGSPPEAEPSSSSRSATALAAIVGLAFLVAVAYVAKRRFLDAADGQAPNAEFGTEVDDAYDVAG